MTTMAAAEATGLVMSLSPELEEPVVPVMSKKRKRGTKVMISAKDDSKKSKSKKKKTDEEDGLDIELGINTAFAYMNSQLVADHVAQKTRKYESDLSSIELEDKYIPGVYFSPE
jgi:protein CMS1